MIPELLMMIKVEVEQWANAGAKNLWCLASGVASCHSSFNVIYGVLGLSLGCTELFLTS